MTVQIGRPETERLVISLCADAAVRSGNSCAAEIARGAVAGGLAALATAKDHAEVVAFVQALLVRLTVSNSVH